MQRRTLLAALPIAMAGTPGGVRAQDYPSRPLRLVIPGRRVRLPIWAGGFWRTI
jgi:hypothetical protein